MAQRALVATLTMTALMFAGAGAAHAVPAFAVQTGQPCSSCHVGGYGPQLTPFGREFKLNGYTQRAVINLPISMMVLTSVEHTNKAQASAPAAHVATNNATVVDQTSVFLAGGVGDHLGGFVQTTYSGIDRSFAWDNLDLRAVTHTTLAKKDLLLGVSVNNAPGVQDVWNTLPAWGFPYVASDLAPTPAAAPLMAGGLAQSVIGVTGYARWNSALYAEAGAYFDPGKGFLETVGVAPEDTSRVDGAAPYARIAYQMEIGERQNLELGAFLLNAHLFPGRDTSAGTTDKFFDLGVDGSYQFLGDKGRAVTVNASYIHEAQDLAASYILGGPAQAKHTLNDLMGDVAYNWSNGLGATLGVFNTWGAKDVGLYPSADGSPNSTGLIAQGDFTPWPNGHSPFGPRFNMRLGLQFTHYFRFDGAVDNIDGAGRNAADNDLLWAFAWMAF